MPIKFTGIGHIALRCKDYSKEQAFYTEKLGFEKLGDVIEEKECFGLFRCPGQQGVRLYYQEAKTDEARYIGDNRQCERSHFHACFLTTDRMKVIKDLEDKGILVTRREDGSVGLCRSYCQFIEDPEGNVWEIMEFTDESMQLVCDTPGKEAER